MGNTLLSEKQKEAGYFFIEENSGFLYLHINKILFRQDYTLGLQSLINLQSQHGNNYLDILSLHDDSQSYVIQLSKYKKEATLSINTLRELQTILQEQHQKSGVRILPLYENAWIVLEGLDQIIEEYFIFQQFPQSQIQGYISNINLIEFLIDQEIADKHSQYINPQNVKEIPDKIFQKEDQINRIHFQNIRSYTHVKRVCESLNQKFLDQPFLRAQVESIVFDNSDTFNSVAENKLSQFDEIVSTFSHVKEFFLRNMDFGQRKKLLQNIFIPSLKQLKQVRTLDISGNNISDFSFTLKQEDGEDNYNKNSQPEHFVIDEEESKENVANLKEESQQVMQEEDTFAYEHLRTLCLNTNAFLTSQNIESVFYTKEISKIEELYLINNRIGQIQIDDTRFALKNLTYLNFTANKINNSSALAIFTSESLRCLKKLVLRCNDIQRIIENPSQCTLNNLEYLDLTRNKIESEYLYLIFCAPALSNLQELSLHMNSEITQFPSITKETFALRSIKHLNLSKNQIKTEGFLQLLEFLPSSIENINLNSNKISLKPEHKQQIESIFENNNNNCSINLKILNLKNNMIIETEPLFKYFRQLRVLDISHNLISNISKPIELKYIFKLDISYNQIISTDDLFSYLHLSPNLNCLNLSNNNISSILKHTYGPISVSKLDLSFNQISDISSQILFSCTNFGKLRQINLSFNQFEHPISVNNIQSLQTLHLASNKISDQGFQMILNQKFESLRELDLYANKLENINYKSNLQEKFISLKRVLLSKNELNVLDIFKIIFMFGFVQELNLDNNLLALPDESQGKVLEFLELVKHTQLKIDNFSYKNSFVDSSIAEVLLPLLNQSVSINLSKNQISNLPVLSNNKLEKLDLCENSLKSDSSHNIFTSNLPKLRILNFSKNQIDTLFNPEKIDEVILNSLEEIDCSFNHIIAKSCQTILGSTKFVNLQKINFRNNKVIYPVPEFQFEIKCTKLFSIILQNNGIETQGAENLFSAKSDSLKFLDLSFNKIKEKIQLKEVGLFNIEALDLSGNQLGDEGCAEFLKCIELRKLQNLNISMNRMRVVPEQFLLPSLWMLNISGNQSIGIYSKIEEYQNLNYFVKVIL